MSLMNLPKPHHFINADGTCHAGDLFEHGTETAGVYLGATVEQIVARHTAAAVAAFKAEAADELTVEAMRHSGIAHSLCDAYMRAADIVRNLSAEVAR